MAAQHGVDVKGVGAVDVDVVVLGRSQVGKGLAVVAGARSSSSIHARDTKQTRCFLLRGFHPWL